MKINEILKELDNFAPLKLSKEYCEKFECYDNSGVVLSTDENIHKIVFSLDLTESAFNLAMDNDCKLIITHHPAIYMPNSELTNSQIIDELEENELLARCKVNKIGVISFHLNLDFAQYGIDYIFAKKLGAENEQILTKLSIPNTGYGRKFSNSMTIFELKEKIKKEFNTQRMFVYGDDNFVPKHICSFCGGGLDFQEIEMSDKDDLLISADIPHHVLLKAIESGRSVINLTHYASEVYGLYNLYTLVTELYNGKVDCMFNLENKYL